MNELTEKEQQEEAPGTEKATGTRGRTLVVVVLLVLLLINGAVLFYLFREVQIIASGSSRSSGELAERLEVTGGQINLLQQQNTLLESRLQQLQSGLDSVSLNFSELYQRNNADIGWQLAEIKYLLLIATHRLQLERDVDTALIALQTADRYLRDMADPGLLPVREQVISNIKKLKEAKPVDIVGMSVTLSNLSRSAGELPLNRKITGATMPAEETAVSGDTDSGWKRLTGSVWQELKTLVVVSRSNSEAVATLLPSERYFLYQNLRLQLQSARLALLAKDAETFRDSVQLVNDWLLQYFDTGDNDVKVALDFLDEMLKVDLDHAPPSIAASITALENYIQQTTEHDLPGTDTDG